ncbi:MAG: glutamine--tRNA ligase/YqeY domain fusion protein [Eubacteriales bacterium]|nr:glutamine--tRNA ligase/YqeY domain fusion protein [Eubacteriales bacterium]
MEYPVKAEVKDAANFIEEEINADILAGKVPHHIHTRFPPEPNGYIHIGHVKAMCIDFNTAEKYGGLCNLRFDDTNPEKEDIEYVNALMQDIAWMGYDITGGVFYGSDYSQQIYDFAEQLIGSGDAYVDELTPDETRTYRGTLTEPGKNSPWRDRPAHESLDLFRRMRAGEFENGARTLRAKIDMASPNVLLRDPVIYRIKHATHWRTGDDWCIYPMYDFAHPIQDALEGITHSLCSLEYEIHRPLYDWVIDRLGFAHRPRQIEFARLKITGTLLSKRYLRQLVFSGYMSGWDDPRMPTLRGMRRRGFTPSAIRDFIGRAGVSKADSTVDYGLLEACVREDLDAAAPRAMAVLEPLKVVLTNWPADRIDYMECENHPKNPDMGTRKVAFGRELYIERGDFMEEPVKGFFRLKPGGEVRLKSAYIIRCEDVIKDEDGAVVQVNCTVDMDSRTGMEGANRKVKGTLHWVEAGTSVLAEVRLYDRLILDEYEDADDENEEAFGRDKVIDVMARVNPASKTVLSGCRVEAMLGGAAAEQRYQFVRNGYFCADADSTAQRPVFNRVVSLKDSWARQQKKG